MSSFSLDAPTGSYVWEERISFPPVAHAATGRHRITVILIVVGIIFCGVALFRGQK